MGYREYFGTQHPIYTNISAQFTGIGHLIIDGGALITNIASRYGARYECLPLHTFMHGTRFVLSNLSKAGFKDITMFFGQEHGHRRVIREYLMGMFKGRDMSEICGYLENSRVALVLGGKEESGLRFIYECLEMSLYCGILDDMEFRLPYVYAFVYRPLEQQCKEGFSVVEDGEDSSSGSSGDIDEDIREINPSMSMERMDKLFGSWTGEFGRSEDCVPRGLCKKLARLFRGCVGSRRWMNFDGRFLFPLSKKEGEEEEWSYEDVVGDGHRDVEKKDGGMELELLVNKREIRDTSAAIHMRNIRKSAQSLFEGKMLYAPVVRSKEVRAPRISQKQRRIMEENERRLRGEQEAKDNAWLKNFFNKYKNMDNQGKRNLLESVRADRSGIYRKVLLLKIEFYADVWRLEKRAEECDEGVIVPCYLCCLEYIWTFGGLEDSERGPDGELEFAFQNLIGCGFEATARELIERYNLGHLRLEFFTSDTSAPSEFDLCFQLKYAGDKLQRSVNSRKDGRVLFRPDEWQVRLLDIVDENKSAVISAPTSAGKTFICFYAIEKVLRQSDTDVVIFCLPTKALVNQVSADIYARFTPKVNAKTFLQGSLMKEFSMEPWNCQVLIIIPSLLESVLNSPPPGFVSRVKYIIIDEVHKIGGEEMGIPIERIIHLSPCPMLVLSATLGNIEGFYGWMRKIEEEKGRECELVSYNERYCELKPYVYSHDGERARIVAINNLFAYSYSHVKRFGFGNDINFLPEELLHLYDSICAVLSKEQMGLVERLRPEKFFKSNIIRKSEVKEYESHLLRTFQEMIEEDLLSEKQVRYVYRLQTKETKKAFERVVDYSGTYLLDNMLSLLNELKERDMLPCIVFNTDRDFVSKLALRVYQELESQDIERKRDRLAEKMRKEAKRSRDVEKTRSSWMEASVAAEQSFQMKADKKNIRYTFLDPVTKLTDYELEEETRYIKNTEFGFIDMLYRGIGVHHAHMNRKYRSLVEILFRQKHLRVLFATETLALGINMPCRSVVFAGDSLQLDPMNYKQMAGRAGRRGFDTLGNIVFMGIPRQRVQNLMVSLLPDIKGVYTYSNTSFVGFDIQGSLVRNPLLESTLYRSGDVAESLGQLRVGASSDYDLSELYGSEERRRELVDYQLSLLRPYFLPRSYLCDLVIGNRDTDPSILSFALLVESRVLPLEPTSLMITLAHFFETRPLLFDVGCTLPPLDPCVYEFCRKINRVSVCSVSRFYSPILRSLQKMSSTPLHTIYSFLCVENVDKIKNSYLLDFFKHGSWDRISTENRVGTGELFKSLSVINNVVLSLIRLYDVYELDGGDRAKIAQFYSMFEPKFKAMFA